MNLSLGDFGAPFQIKAVVLERLHKNLGNVTFRDAAQAGLDGWENEGWFNHAHRPTLLAPEEMNAQCTRVHK